MTRKTAYLTLAGIVASSALIVLTGDLSPAWARRVLEFTVLLNFGMICFAVVITWRVLKTMSIAHGVRTHLATITGLGNVLQQHEFTPKSKEAILSAIVEESRQGLIVLDGASRAELELVPEAPEADAATA